MPTSHMIDALMQRQARLHVAREATVRLKPDERQQFLAELIETLEPIFAAKSAVETSPQVAPTTSAHSESASPARPSIPRKDPSKTDQAEAFVFAHPEGVAFHEIVTAISQESSAAASTLQYLKTKRKTIENRDNRWYPVAHQAQGVGGARKSAYREVILGVLAKSEPLETKDIFNRVKEVLPEASYQSTASEIKRMHRRKQIVQRGDGKNGRLYGVTRSVARSERQRSLPGVAAT